jgi:hypothetical protein
MHDNSSFCVLGSTLFISTPWIPAGTGARRFQKLIVGSKEELETVTEARERSSSRRGKRELTN